jgi:magnesium-transporting ATPase (P-type)
MTSGGALLLILAALFAVFPPVLVYPLCLIFVWLGVELLYRSYTLHREGKREDGALRFELVQALAAANRANNAVLQERDGRWTVQGDPTEAALIVAARQAGLEDEALDARFAGVAEVPFSSERKLMSTIHTDAERQEHLLALTKGAPDIWRHTSCGSTW